MKITRSKTDEQRLDEATMALAAAQARKSDAEKAEGEAKKVVIDLMVRLQKKDTVVKTGDKAYKAVVVRPQRVEVDTEKLIEDIKESFDDGLDILDEITTRKVVLKSLEAAMEQDPGLEKVALPHLTLKDSTPYVRLYEGGVDDFDAEDAD